MAVILHTPNREQIVTSNVWVFLHWLRTTRGVDLPDWGGLQRWSVADNAAFASAIGAFAQLPDTLLRLSRHEGQQESLVLRWAGGERLVVDREGFRQPDPDPSPQVGEAELGGHIDFRLRRRIGVGSLPAEIAAPLMRLWPPALLIRPLAELLLHADLRRDDRLLVAGTAPWPWLAALLEGTTVILTAATSDMLLSIAAEERATVLVVPAQILAEAAFQRARRRPNLVHLRSIIATGGPLSPQGRTRVYTWIKSDLMLLARTGDTLWGNPLEPVYTRPVATPGFLMPPPSTPATC